MRFTEHPDLEPLTDGELADLVEPRPNIVLQALRDPWAALARVLARPAVVNALFAYAVQRPFYTLYHEDGSIYMTRLWLLPRWCLRWVDDNRGGHYDVRSWVPIRPRLHIIHTPDYDREKHDHPADYRTLILDGYYVEEDIFCVKRLLRAGDTEKRRAQDFHRIDSVSPAGVLTLFTFFGGKRHTWGFLLGGRKVPHYDYAAAKAAAEAA